MSFRRRRLAAAAFIAIAVTGMVALLAGFRTDSSMHRADNRPPTAVAPEPDTLPGEREIRALSASYPDRITATAVHDEEWALQMDGRWYTWADGRLLPKDLRIDPRSFVPLRFYRYELGPLKPREITEELTRVLEDRTSQHSSGTTDARERPADFLDTLYRIGSQVEAERLVRRVEFLGFATRVHPLLVDPLAAVERTILATVPHDDEVAAFVAGLSAAHGYNWRTIAGTARRSYHSYGVAVDLVPRSYNGTWPYWLWAAQAGIQEWWNLPLGTRWPVPQPVIDAFEEHGFIWGGKWLFFDNLHFEYRPESIAMAQSQKPD